jgi:hypothetical protein
VKKSNNGKLHKKETLHLTGRFSEMGVEVIARIAVKRFTVSDSPSVSAVES